MTILLNIVSIFVHLKFTSYLKCMLYVNGAKGLPPLQDSNVLEFSLKKEIELLHIIIKTLDLNIYVYYTKSLFISHSLLSLRVPQNVPTLEFKERNISAFYDFKCQVIVFPVMYVSLIVIARYHKPRMEEDHFRIADGKRHAL